MIFSYNNQLSGEFGSKYITNAAGAQTGNYCALLALADATITGLDGASACNMTSAPASFSLPAGLVLPGIFNSFTVTAGGPVIALKRKS